MNRLQYLRDVVTLVLDGDRCTGCGACIEVCPHQVFSTHGGKVSIGDRDSCMECGACALNCPAEAISVDAGVGCAYAVIKGKVKGTDPDCGCCD
jgi:NAD-dependent dihydropyrimidine dehydrogenase PreA subunit